VPSSSYTPQLRPLSIGEVLDAGFRLLRHRFGTLMLCVLAAGLPLSILRTIIIASTDPDYYDVNAVQFGDTPTEVIVGQIVAALVVLLGAMVAIAACFRVISAAYLGEPVTAGQSLRAGVRRIPALFVSFVVLGVIFFVLLVIAVASRGVLAPVFIFFLVKLALSWPAIVAERAGPFRAIGRSWRLTRKSWWRSFAVLLVLGIITLVLYYAFAAAVYAALNSMDSISEIALATVDTLFIVIALALIYPLNAAILAVLYYDQRVRKEGFDLQLLADSIGSDASRFERPPERPETVAGPSAPAPTPVPASSSSGGFAPPEGPASTP
jgi:membrane-anchored glycerophosphoryl diester phosphodiesterase (GDPDase)